MLLLFPWLMHKYANKQYVTQNEDVTAVIPRAHPETESTTKSTSWNRINQSPSQYLSTSETQSIIINFFLLFKNCAIQRNQWCNEGCNHLGTIMYTATLDFWFFLSQRHCLRGLLVNTSMGSAVSRNIHRQISSLLKVQLTWVLYFMSGLWQ